MSTLKADTIVAADGSSAVTLTKQSAAKVWVNFNGTSTISSRNSLNVSSLTDNGTGNYTVNFTNNHSGGDWACSGNIQQGITVTPGSSYFDKLQAYKVQQSNYVSLWANTEGNQTGIGDCNYVQANTHGDLA